MSPLERLLKKNKRLRDIPDDFIKKLGKVQKKQFLTLITILNDMSKKGEAISATDIKNFLLVDKIKQDLKDDLINGDYKEAVKEFSTEFGKQMDFNDEYYSRLSDKYKGDVAEEAVKRIQKSTVENLIKDSVEKDFLKPLESILNNAVASGSDFTETLVRINTFVEGNEDEYGAIEKYAKQLAHDSFANADRAYGNAVADELELEFFLYAGDEIQTTRCFCQERHGKFYHWKEIAEWGRGENVGSCGFPWQGMNRDTNETTIFNYAGGYNCLHSIAGVSIFDVPKDDVQRNVDNGNYEPSEFEVEEIGL